MSEARAVLAIESSQRAGTIALRAAPGAAILEREVPRSDDEHDYLLAEIDALCAAAGVKPAGIACIAVSVGPGGFTGLRVACATAKAIAETVGARLVAVPSALVVARTLARAGALGDGPAMVALACKGQTAWCERVRVAGGAPVSEDAGLHDAATAPWVGGAGDAGAGAGAGATLIADAHLPESFLAEAQRRGVALMQARWSAAACLEIAESRIAAGDFTDALKLSPIYPRIPEAVSLWEARHGGAGR
ncbi:MAG: tRNA (adenosine(37)-N6)-threonylcarbamoyltransferase complex dimerization subunit type 1 TsaB [Phycisphaerales bacterium]